MKKLAWIFLLLISVTGFAQKKPNIIVILADDLGYGDLGCYGQTKFETPNLDRLASMGIRFTQFYSGSTVCAPARCSFMTGLHTGHTAVRGNVTIKPEGQFPLPDSVTTIAQILRKNGYATGAFGKWSLGFITTTGDPQKKGFDQFFGYNCQSLAHNYWPDHLWENHKRVDLSGNLQSDSVYSADLIHSKALKWLSQRDTKPFFLYLPYTLPHADVVVPHDSVYEYFVKKFDEPPIVEKSADRGAHRFDPYPHAAFAAMVSRLDRYVGEIMAMVKKKGLEENTWIFFASDNGPHRENGGDPEFFNGSGGLSGIKRDLYEGGIRVPFIAWKKGMSLKGKESATPLVLYDLFPTFLEMAAIRPVRNIDGISILPALTGKKQQLHEYLYWELHESGGKQAVRMGKWKAVRLNVSRPGTLHTALYDLESDPKEKKDVSVENPELTAKMEAIMKKAYVANRDWPLFAAEGAK
jgi:arylsulfatase A